MTQLTEVICTGKKALMDGAMRSSQKSSKSKVFGLKQAFIRASMGKRQDFKLLIS